MSTNFSLRGVASGADQISGGQSLGNVVKSVPAWFGVREALYDNIAQDVTSRLSNLGSVNPTKGPTARSLFYNAAQYTGDDAKYGQFLFYSFNGQNNDFIREYYLSERPQFNSKISPVISRNPSAGRLVKETQENLAADGDQRNNQSTNTGNNTTGNKSFIIGGLSAPYFWKDFLYCKYYGAIPNNYMITLRRFPAPMRDNLSIPDQLKTSDLYKKQGAGRPVAQAVTWWGGQTGNSLNEIIGFTTGLKWDEKFQKEVLKQNGFEQGFFKTVLGRAIAGTASVAGLDDILAAMGDAANILIASTDSGRAQITTSKINMALRDKMSMDDGPLSDFIFAPVDTVERGLFRSRGLVFDGGFITIKFHYELTSLGEVNTKAAIADIIGNLLSIGTNYGNFLTPDMRYDNGFPAIGFPGGDKGLESFYSDPLKFVKTALKFINNPDEETMGDPTAESLKQFKQNIDGVSSKLQSILKQLTTKNLNEVIADIDGPIANVLAFAISKDLIETYQYPLAFKTGAPVGEWHLVVGNPMNPIAMIGNLVCKELDIEFSEVLGPDDFPTEIIATFTLEHGRDRERGEIESMFNRGDGRLYQSTLPTYANNQSLASVATSRGENLPYSQDDTTTAYPYDSLSNNSGGYAPEITQ
jgi:hypothetical protein